MFISDQVYFLQFMRSYGGSMRLNFKQHHKWIDTLRFFWPIMLLILCPIVCSSISMVTEKNRYKQLHWSPKKKRFTVENLVFAFMGMFSSFEHNSYLITYFRGVVVQISYQVRIFFIIHSSLLYTESTNWQILAYTLFYEYSKSKILYVQKLFDS